MNETRKTVIVAAIAAVLMACVAVAQTHYNLTNNQNFTTANGKSLTGTYQCSGAGAIQDCALSGVTISSPTITGGTLNGTTWIAGSFGRQTTLGDGVFQCNGSDTVSYGLTNNCYMNGNYVFGDGGATTQLNAAAATTLTIGSIGITGASTNTIDMGTTGKFTTNVRTDGALLVNNTINGIDPLQVFNNGATNKVFLVKLITNGVNHLDMYGSAAGSAVKIGTDGNDAAISINLAPKGTGKLQIGGTDTLTAVKTVRASGGAADCNLTFTNGLLTATTC